MQNQQINSCRICGYSNDELKLWGNDGKYPMFEICPCCGIESGYEDISSDSIEYNRQKWIASQNYKSDIKYKIQLKKILTQT